MMSQSSAAANVTSKAATPRIYVGLDVHQSHSTMHVLDAQGNCLQRQTIRGYWPRVALEIEKLSHDEQGQVRQIHVCFEASVGAGHLYDLLQRCCHRVVVAHPGHLRLIFRSRKKNDRADAEKLAKLLFLDEVPAAYMPAKSVRNWRKLIETRRRTVEKRARVKNSLRALLRGCGIQVPKEFGLWSKRGLDWLAQHGFDDTHALQRDLWLDELDLLTEATWHAIRLSPTVKSTFERIHHGDRERRKIALVATSHALVRAMYAMLRDNKPWRETVLPQTVPA